MADHVICPLCGGHNAADARECSACATHFVVAGAPPSAQPGPPQSPPSEMFGQPLDSASAGAAFTAGVVTSTPQSVVDAPALGTPPFIASLPAPSAPPPFVVPEQPVGFAPPPDAAMPPPQAPAEPPLGPPPTAAAPPTERPRVAFPPPEPQPAKAADLLFAPIVNPPPAALKPTGLAAAAALPPTTDPAAPAPAAPAAGGGPGWSLRAPSPPLLELPEPVEEAPPPLAGLPALPGAVAPPGPQFPPAMWQVPSGPPPRAGRRSGSRLALSVGALLVVVGLVAFAVLSVLGAQRTLTLPSTLLGEQPVTSTALQAALSQATTQMQNADAGDSLTKTIVGAYGTAVGSRDLVIFVAAQGNIRNETQAEIAQDMTTIGVPDVSTEQFAVKDNVTYFCFLSTLDGSTLNVCGWEESHTLGMTLSVRQITLSDIESVYASAVS